MAKFSVVIPVYRAENTIQRCVESIINNTFQDLEIILVEDCSGDNSWQICQELAQKYENVTVFHNEKNRGVSYTRNRGIRAVTGEYTMFVDSDDWVDASYYEVFSKMIEQYSSELIVCGFVNHDEKHSGRTDRYVLSEADLIEELNYPQSIETLYEKTLLQQLWNKAFRTQIIRENNISFDESISIGEDFRFILKYLQYAKPTGIMFVNKALYHYMRDQDGSLMYRVGLESIEEPLANLASMYRLIGMKEEHITELIGQKRQDLKRQYAYLIMHNAGMPLKKRKELICALDPVQGKAMYRSNLILWVKEKAARLMNRAKKA